MVHLNGTYPYTELTVVSVQRFISFNVVFTCSLYTKNWDKSHVWELCESMPVQKSRYAMFAFDAQIYVAGGDNDGKYSDQFHCYNTKTNEWTEKAPVQLRSTNVILLKLNNCVYAIGSAASLHKYDPEKDRWTVVSIGWIRAANSTALKQFYFILRKDDYAKRNRLFIRLNIVTKSTPFATEENSE